MTDQHCIRIVPAQHAGTGPTPTRGTELFVGDTKINGVYGVTLRADVDNVWRATIECHVQPPAELLAQSVIVVAKRQPWWQRALAWITGEPNDVTALEHHTRQWEA